MTSLPQNVKGVFFETLLGHLSIQEFETWAKSSYDLVSNVSPELHHTLMTLNYQSTQAAATLLPMLNRLIDQGEYETYRMLKLLHNLKLSNGNLPKLLEEVYTLYLFDYDFLKDLVALRERSIADPSINLQPEISKVAQNIIDLINAGKIVLTGYWDDDARSYSYQDLRS